MTNILKVLANNFSIARQQLGLSQRECAELAKVDVSVLRGLEQARTWPKLHNLEALCRAVKRDPLDLFQREAPPEPVRIEHPLRVCASNLLKAAEELEALKKGDPEN